MSSLLYSEKLSLIPQVFFSVFPRVLHIDPSWSIVYYYNYLLKYLPPPGRMRSLNAGRNGLFVWRLWWQLPGEGREWRTRGRAPTSSLQTLIPCPHLSACRPMPALLDSRGDSLMAEAVFHPSISNEPWQGSETAGEQLLSSCTMLFMFFCDREHSWDLLNKTDLSSSRHISGKA